MALPVLNWKLLTPRTFTGSTINDVLNLLAAMGQSTTYADNSARVPGTGSAWTWSIDNANAVQPGVTTAIYGTPPINALNMGYIISGSTSVASPGGTYNTDSYSQNLLLLSMNKNSGPYTTWTNAAPWTTGQFSGMIRGTRVSTPTSGYQFYWYECEEAFLITFGSGSAVQVLGAGAVIDPLSAAAANAESDGRLYSIFGNGSGTELASNFLSTTATNLSFMNSGTTGGDPHFFTFNVGAVNTTRNIKRLAAYTTAQMLLLPSGKPMLLPEQMLFSTSSNYAGQLRSIYVSKFGTNGTAWNDNGVVYGYTLASSFTASGEMLFFST